MFKTKRSKLSSRVLWRTIHVYSSIIFVIPLLLVSISGFILTFEHELRHWDQPLYYDLEPNDNPLSTNQVIALIKREYLGSTLHYTAIPESPRSAYSTFATIKQDGKDRSARLYVDQYRGIVMLDESGLSVLEFITRLHRTLFLWKWGRYVVGACAIALFFSAVTGLLTWFPRRRGTVKRLRTYNDSLSWHNALGVILSIIILLIAFTGATFTFGSVINPAIYTITFSAPKSVAPQSEEPFDREPVGLITAVEAVSKSLADQAHITAFLEPSPNKIRGAYSVHVKRRDGLVKSVTDITYWVDRYTGQVIDQSNLWKTSPGEIYQATFWALHTGLMFNFPLRTLWGVMAGAGPVFFIVTGVIWYRRKRGAWPPKNLIK